MPRAPRKTASPTFTVQLASIGDEDAKRLEVLVGAPVAGLFRLDVETAVGIKANAELHLDQIPRPSDYSREFKEVRVAALALRNKLSNWSDYYREQFAVHGEGVQKIEAALAALIEVSDAVVNKSAGVSSKGAGKELALTLAILRLRDLFLVNYSGPATGKVRRQNEFIREALIAGRAVPTKYDGVAAILRRADKK